MILKLLLIVSVLQQSGLVNFFVASCMAVILMLTQVFRKKFSFPSAILFIVILSTFFPLLSTLFEALQPVSSITFRPLLVHIGAICIYILSLVFVFTVKIDDLRKLAYLFVNWSLPISIFCVVLSLQNLLSAVTKGTYLGGGTFLACVGLAVSVFCIPSVSQISQRLQYCNLVSILLYTLAILSAGKRGVIIAILPTLLLTIIRLIRSCMSSILRLKFNYLFLLSLSVVAIFLIANIPLILPTIYKLFPFLNSDNVGQLTLNSYSASRLLEFQSFMSTFSLDYLKLITHGLTFGLGIGWQFSFNLAGMYTASLHNSIVFMTIIIGLPFLLVVILLVTKYSYFIKPTHFLSENDQFLSFTIASHYEVYSFYQFMFALISLQIFLLSLTSNALVSSPFCMVLFLLPIAFDTRNFK